MISLIAAVALGRAHPERCLGSLVSTMQNVPTATSQRDRFGVIINTHDNEVVRIDKLVGISGGTPVAVIYVTGDGTQYLSGIARNDAELTAVRALFKRIYPGKNAGVEPLANAPNLASLRLPEHFNPTSYGLRREPCVALPGG